MSEVLTEVGTKVVAEGGGTGPLLFICEREPAKKLGFTIRR
jgi:hypothetical protein